MVKTKKKKIYVLDTSVLLHDHNALISFEKNDVAIPISVLEELDKFKIGSDTKNYSAREVIRFLDNITEDEVLDKWIKIGESDLGRIKIVIPSGKLKVDAEKVFDKTKNDHKIINAALQIAEEEKTTEVVLVSKDINLRLKARALNLPAEDYETGKVNEAIDLQKGISNIENLDSEIINEIFRKNFIEDTSFLGEEKINNRFYILKNGTASTLAYYNPFEDRVDRVEKTYSFGIKPKNAEQAFALHAIMNPDIRLVCLQGVAGTGKTLLALAGSLEQRNNYDQIILARPIIPLSNRDLGFLPGNVDDKIRPYMEPLFDNLKFIKSQYKENEKKSKLIDELEKDEKLKIIPLAYIRGRSFSNIMFIIDEAQNLTPHEVKTIITRAGEGTKIIFTGDVYQIDTPYLDAQSNGLSYLIDKLKGNRLFAHVKLERGERSELANLANELL